MNDNPHATMPLADRTYPYLGKNIAASPLGAPGLLVLFTAPAEGFCVLGANTDAPPAYNKNKKTLGDLFHTNWAERQFEPVADCLSENIAFKITISATRTSVEVLA